MNILSKKIYLKFLIIILSTCTTCYAQIENEDSFQLILAKADSLYADNQY